MLRAVVIDYIVSVDIKKPACAVGCKSINSTYRRWRSQCKVIFFNMWMESVPPTHFIDCTWVSDPVIFSLPGSLYQPWQICELSLVLTCPDEDCELKDRGGKNEKLMFWFWFVFFLMLIVWRKKLEVDPLTAPNLMNLRSRWARPWRLVLQMVSHKEPQSVTPRGPQSGLLFFFFFLS